VEVSPVKALYAVGDVITCVADGRPEPWYQFLNLDNNEVFKGPTFTVSGDLRGAVTPMRCQAQNIIQGKLFSESVFFYVNVQ
jgi:hypothetical protein